MRHRKLNHKMVLCKMFLKNKCDYSGEDCYFTHAKEPQAPPAKIVARPSEQTPSETQGFWNTHPNLAPPLKVSTNQQGPTQSEWIQMKEALRNLNQMMSRFQ